MDLTICPLIDNNLDLLDRQPFVDNILRVAEALSDNKKNACYAINGSWGVGKTFVLDMFENQAKDIGREGETLHRYLVFRYNCWEYDYYGEPLIAIVASMLDQIDANEHLIPQEIRSKIVAILKVIGKGLVKKTVQIASDATSVDIANIIDKISEISNDSEEKQKEVNAYDQYFEFKKILLKLQETIKELSENQTLIFIVDELDRCLPEYTIKVLERLHHLFNGIPNVQVVIAIDKGQLEHVVKQIYGEQTDVNKYLAKFISFELKLGDSVFSDQEKFVERFRQYTSRFEITFDITNQADVDDFIKDIFMGVDIRSRISILDKCLLLHSLQNKDNEKKDSSLMCVELMLAVVKYANVDIAKSKSKNRISRGGIFAMPEDKELIEGLTLLSNRFSSIPTEDYTIGGYYSERGTIISISDLWSLLYAAYRHIIGIEIDRYQNNPGYIQLLNNSAENFWRLMQTII